MIRQTGTSLSEHAYLVIRDRILRGDLRLGASLSRRKLAAELGISMLPVAEALQRLENDGLVESRPRVGTQVCSPNAEEIRERYEVREALESHAARLFATRASAKDKFELERMADHLDAMFGQLFSSGRQDRDFLFAVQSYHAQFHFRIAECTGCRFLRDAIEKNHVLIFNWLFDVAAERPPLPPRHHRTLMEAINQGDAEQADRAMRQHIQYGIETIVDQLASSAGPSAVERTK